MGSNPYYFGAPPQVNPMGGLMAALEYKLAQKKQAAEESYQQGELANRQAVIPYYQETAKTLAQERETQNQLGQQKVQDVIEKKAFQEEVRTATEGITNPHEQLAIAYGIARHRYPKIADGMWQIMKEDWDQQQAAKKIPEAQTKEFAPPGETAGVYQNMGVASDLPAAPTVQAQPDELGNMQLEPKPGVGLQTPVPNWQRIGDVKPPPEPKPSTAGIGRTIDVGGKKMQYNPDTGLYDIYVGPSDKATEDKAQTEKDRRIRLGIENRKIARLDALNRTYRAGQAAGSLNPMDEAELNQKKGEIQNDYEAQLAAAGFEVVPQAETAPPSNSPAMMPSHGNGRPTGRPTITPQQALEELKRRGRL
jgi:hypothetical protein